MEDIKALVKLLRLKMTKSEVKNMLDAIHGGFGSAGEKINELDDVTLETF